MKPLVLNTKTFCPKQSCMKKNPLFDLVVKGLDHCDLILGCATVPCPYIYKYIYIYMQNMMILGLETNKLWPCKFVSEEELKET